MSLCRTEDSAILAEKLLKANLLVFTIIVKAGAGVVPTKTDRNAMNLTWLYEERNKNGERLESKKKKKETKRQLINKIPTQKDN